MERTEPTAKGSVKEDLTIFHQFAKKPSKELKTSATTNCVIYTRVSTKEQEEGFSLEIQLETAQSYARKQGWNIIGNFGGKYESAQSDERKEFNRMLSFVKKSKERITYIIVYSVDRFSRTGANAIYIAEQLRKENIKIVAVTQPADTSTPSGILQQNIQFIFSQYDNDLRREKCTAGMKEKLLKGYWIGHAPLGYDMVTKSKEQILTINHKGRLLQQAFIWKSEGVCNTEIAQRLAARGLKIYKQALHRIFQNPFYCGLITNNLLGGKVIEGKHPQLVSREVFLQINRIKHYKSPHKKEFPNTPLKHLVICSRCRTPFSGYEVKKKRLHYYKCSTIGCRTNRSAKILHEKFWNLLSKFKIDEKLVPILHDELVNVFEEVNGGNARAVKEIKAQLHEVKSKIEKVEERYVYGEINKDLYDKFITKLNDEKAVILRKLQDVDFEISNLDEYINLSLQLAANLHKIWENSDYWIKEELQSILFPRGIVYDSEKEEYRTDEVNEVFIKILSLSRRLRGDKKEHTDENARVSHSVAPAEPISNQIYEDLRDLYVLRDIVKIV